MWGLCGIFMLGFYYTYPRESYSLNGKLARASRASVADGTAVKGKEGLELPEGTLTGRVETEDGDAKAVGSTTPVSTEETSYASAGADTTIVATETYGDHTV